jgi:integrase
MPWSAIAPSRTRHVASTGQHGKNTISSLLTLSVSGSGARRFWRAFKDLLAKSELPDMRVHDLRHTAATLLLAEGVPVKVASELLGHSDVQTTLRIYAHVIEGTQEEAASAMDRLFHR